LGAGGRRFDPGRPDQQKARLYVLSSGDLVAPANLMFTGDVHFFPIGGLASPAGQRLR
jgi:hypothetical protein